MKSPESAQHHQPEREVRPENIRRLDDVFTQLALANRWYGVKNRIEAGEAVEGNEVMRAWILANAEIYRDFAVKYGAEEIDVNQLGEIDEVLRRMGIG